MRPHSSLRLATWILERLDLADEAFVGDLVEAHHAGRSNAWVWRQTALAVVIGVGREIGGHKPAAVGAVCASFVAISLSTYLGAQLTAFAGRWTWTGGAESWRDVSAGLVYRLPFLLGCCLGGACGGWLVARLRRIHGARMVAVFALFPLCSSLLYILRTLKAAAGLNPLPAMNFLFAAVAFMAMAGGALATGCWAATRAGSSGP